MTSGMAVQVAEMSGHTSRVLHLAQSPDGTTVCSGAADETLRFWKCFAEAAPAQKVCLAFPGRKAVFVLSFVLVCPARAVSDVYSACPETGQELDQQQ